MRGTELQRKCCARTPFTVFDSRQGGNASTGAWRLFFFTIQLTTYIYLNHARRPQSRKGRLAADALRQRRDGVKEDYYV